MRIDTTTLSSPLVTNIQYNMLCATFENRKNEILERLNERDIVRFRCGLVTRYDGGRATSSFCGLPTLEKEHDILFKMYREDYLDDMFLARTTGKSMMYQVQFHRWLSQLMRMKRVYVMFTPLVSYRKWEKTFS